MLAACVLIFLPGLIAPWSRLNNEEEELDLYTGRARFSRYFLYICIEQDVRDTPLSTALAADSRSEGREMWVHVNIFQPAVHHSPHFHYHAGFAVINVLANVWEVGHFTDEAKIKSGRQFLCVLREGGSYHAADAYFEQLDPIVLDRDSGSPVLADDIPDDLAEKALTAYWHEGRTENDDEDSGLSAMAGPRAWCRKHLRDLNLSGQLIERQYDLDHDGVNELFIAPVDGGGNAGDPYYVFKKTKTGHELMGETFFHWRAFRVLPAAPDGSLRFVTYHHLSCSEGTLKWWTHKDDHFTVIQTERIHPGDGGTPEGRRRYAELFGP